VTLPTTNTKCTCPMCSEDREKDEFTDWVASLIGNPSVELVKNHTQHHMKRHGMIVASSGKSRCDCLWKAYKSYFKHMP